MTIRRGPHEARTPRVAVVADEYGSPSHAHVRAVRDHLRERFEVQVFFLRDAVPEAGGAPWMPRLFFDLFSGGFDLVHVCDPEAALALVNDTADRCREAQELSDLDRRFLSIPLTTSAPARGGHANGDPDDPLRVWFAAVLSMPEAIADVGSREPRVEAWGAFFERTLGQASRLEGRMTRYHRALRALCWNERVRDAAATAALARERAKGEALARELADKTAGRDFLRVEIDRVDRGIRGILSSRAVACALRVARVHAGLRRLRRVLSLRPVCSEAARTRR